MKRKIIFFIATFPLFLGRYEYERMFSRALRQLWIKEGKDNIKANILLKRKALHNLPTMKFRSKRLFEK